MSFPFVQQTSRTSVALNHVYGFGEQLSIAVGAAGTILRWDGQQWTTSTSGTNQPLAKAWGADSSSIWVVGALGTLLNSTDGGVTWIANASLNTAIGSKGNYVAIWGSTGLDFWVIDQKAGGFWHTTDGGLTWALVQTIAASWQHMWGSNAAYVIACGVTGVSGSVSDVFTQWNGAGWTGRVDPTGPAVGALGCWPNASGPQNWSVGYGSTGALIYDQSSFRPGATKATDSPFSDVAAYSGVYGTVPNTLLAAGVDRSQNYALSYLIPPAGSPSAPSIWGEVTLPSATLPQGKGGLSSVYEDTSGYAVSVGAAGVIVARAGSTLFMVSATPQSTKSVRVTLSAIPLAQSVIGQGDALNPQTWFIQRLDTGQRFTTISVTQVSPTVFDVVIAERFGSSLVQHEVEAATMVDAFGNAIQDPVLLDFAGVASDTNFNQASTTASNGYVITDLRNPPFPPPGSNIGGGTRVITAAGDFAAESGNDLIRKLVLRRITTPKGGFFHLPDYGAGISVKEPLKGGDMVTLRKQIQQQVLLEPEIVAALVQLSLDSNGILSISVTARTNTGQTVVVTASQSTQAVQL